MSFDSAVALLNASAAFIQALFVVVSIAYINRQFGIVRACSYIERFNSHENIRRRGTVDQWLESSNDDDVRIEAFETNPVLRADILGYINLFQELGVAYRYHSVHRATVRETFDFLVPYYWTRTRFLIEHRREERRSPTMYRKFQQLARRLGEQSE